VRDLAARGFRLAAHLPLLFGLVLLWQMASTAGWLDSRSMPSPLTVARDWWHLVVSGELWTHVGASLRRVLTGFALAVIAGVAVGVLVGASSRATTMVRPVLEVLRPIPPIAWVPLAILWLGLGDPPSIFIVALAAFFPICVSTLEAIPSAAPTHRRVLRTLGLSQRSLLINVALPASSPRILTGIRVGMGIAWTSAIAAELVGAQSGLGYFIQQERLQLQVESVMAGMLTIGVLGFALSALLSWLERRFAPLLETDEGDGA
jgi:ABC-type nitrate/sulfonate/bicarbonate transport system permease component